MATQVEQELLHPRRRRQAASGRSGQMPKKKVMKKKQARRFTQETFEIEHILQEKKVSSKARVLYLVQWVGYAEPSWEPQLLLQNTVALQEWKAHSS